MTPQLARIESPSAPLSIPVLKLDRWRRLGSQRSEALDAMALWNVVASKHVQATYWIQVGGDFGLAEAVGIVGLWILTQKSGDFLKLRHLRHFCHRLWHAFAGHPAVSARKWQIMALHPIWCATIVAWNVFGVLGMVTGKIWEGTVEQPQDFVGIISFWLVSWDDDICPHVRYRYCCRRVEALEHKDQYAARIGITHGLLIVFRLAPDRWHVGVYIRQHWKHLEISRA